MLNLVIAILSNTYNRNNALYNALYLNVLVDKFPLYEWDDSYGVIACAKNPFNAFLLFMVPIIYLCEKLGCPLKNVNIWFTRVIYIPTALIIIAMFIVLNTLTLPVAYVMSIGRLFVDTIQ